jgi:hypothetical protein
MEFFTGLDVGTDETVIGVVDDKGKVALETTVVTYLDALKPYLGPAAAGQRRDATPSGS